MKTLTSLLDEYSCSLDANSIMRVMIRYGLAEDVEYISTTGSGEIKRFRRLTDEGLNYGINERSLGHDIKTAPKFYEDTFPTLVSLVVSFLQKESEEMQIITDRPKPLDGKVIAVFGSISSIKRHELRSKLESLGALLTVSLSSKTDIVIFGDGDHANKIGKIEKYNIEVWDESKVIAIFDPEARHAY